jgi:hypothetical protein
LIEVLLIGFVKSIDGATVEALLDIAATIRCTKDRPATAGWAIEEMRADPRSLLRLPLGSRPQLSSDGIEPILKILPAAVRRCLFHGPMHMPLGIPKSNHVHGSDAADKLVDHGSISWS